MSPFLYQQIPKVNILPAHRMDSEHHLSPFSLTRTRWQEACMSVSVGVQTDRHAFCAGKLTYTPPRTLAYTPPANMRLYMLGGVSVESTFQKDKLYA